MSYRTHYLYNALSIVFALSIFTACKREEPKLSDNQYKNGVFVTNEGLFQGGTGTLTFYNKSNKVVNQDVFASANGFPLGNIVQSMTFYQGKGYIIVNNAGKVEVVNGTDLKTIGTIRDLVQPRYFIGVNNSKGYVSQWGDKGVNGAIKVIDLNKNVVTATIPTAKGAERMIKINDLVYVTCNGGFGQDSVVAVINTSTDKLVTSIPVGAAPDGIELDKNGKIWVLCQGQYNSTWDALLKLPKLVQIDPAINGVIRSLEFTNATSMASNLAVGSKADILYYSSQGKVYRHDISSTSLSNTPFILKSFYSLAVDPATDDLYGGVSNSNSNGYVIRYNSASIQVDSFPTGIYPGEFVFN